MPIAVPYFQISLLAFVCRRMYGAIATILKALDKPQWSFALNLIANAINIVGDVVLINGYGPFPKLDALGAAVATVSGCVVGLVCSVIVLRRQMQVRGIRISVADWLQSSWYEMKNICAEALPMAGEKVMIRLGVFLSITRIAALGTTAFAAYRILISLQNFAYLGAEAVATTALIFLSKAYANHDRGAARDAFSSAMVYALGFSSLCAVLFLCIPGLLMSFYSDDPQVLADGVRVLRIIFLYQPFQAVALLYASGMRSCERAVIPSVITTVGIVLIRPTLVYLLVGPLGVCGAWIAIMTDEIVRCVLLLILRGKMWRRFPDRIPQTVSSL